MVVTIKNINPNGERQNKNNIPHYGVGECYIFWENELSLVNDQKIVITSDGKETLARLYEGEKVIKRAVAKCSPDDTFDFATGAKLAFERLMAEEKPTENEEPRFEVGDRVKILEGWCCVGEIGTIVEDDGSTQAPYRVKFANGHAHWKYGKHLEKVVEKFTPHLVSGKEHYGIIGRLTNYKDAIGRPLCIGDVVEVFDEDCESRGHWVIVESKATYRNNKEKVFVMGFESCCDDKAGTIDEYKIIKHRSYEDVKHGEKINMIEYVKESK